MPFLTRIDPNAQIKGSRDPLGVQGIWTLLGRQIVSNLTTVSTSVGDFTTTMLGYAFAERLADDCPEVETFLRWEQWAAYSRVHFGMSKSVRGVERVSAKLRESNAKVTISAAKQHQILSNQKTYGLWGLYSMPSRQCGFIARGAARLTPLASSFLNEQYWPLLEKAYGGAKGKLLDRLRQPTSKVDLDGADRGFASKVGEILSDPSPKRRLNSRELDFHRKHLLHATDLQQTGVATMPPELKADAVLSPARLDAWAKTAEKSLPELAAHLRNVRVAESLLAPAARLFSHLLNCNDRSLSTVARDIKNQWTNSAFSTLDLETLEDLRGKIRDAAGKRQGSDLRWLRVADTMRDAKYEDTIRELCELNAEVMTQRGGARWISIENDKLKVHASEAGANLPSAGELKQLWEHSYFLDSLARVASALDA